MPALDWLPTPPKTPPPWKTQKMPKTSRTSTMKTPPMPASDPLSPKPGLR
jgi:hypothetical protein